MLLIENQDLKEKYSELDSEKKEIEKLHNSVIENSLDGTLIIHDDYIIVYANEETTSITGFEISKLLDNDIREVLSLGSGSQFEKKITSLFATGGKDIRFEFKMQSPLGLTRNLYSSASIIDDFKGERSCVLQILDITEIKQAEEKTKRINAELEERVERRTKELNSTLNNLRSEIAERRKTELQLKNAQLELKSSLDQEKELNTLKTRFISMISHEYRTPLTVILTSTYLIEQFYKGPNIEQFKKFLAKIRSSVKNMTQLLEDVLTIGKDESGKISVNPQNLPLSSLVKDLFEEAKVIDKENHKLLLEDNGDKHYIVTDEKLLRHILSNLILNACKYSPDADKVLVKISELGSGARTIEVIDYGIGIPQENQKQIFEAFYRADNVGAISGTGLGLAIVMRSLRSIKGTIELTSESGKGSNFKITLPPVLDKPQQMIIKNEEDRKKLEEMKKKSFANL
jgi:PAS domain S-box-containing protein